MPVVKAILISTFFILLMSSLPLKAEQTPLTQEQMQALLTGNTAIGGEGDSAWRQYFDPDGSTPYLPAGGKVDIGKWKITEDNKYMSWWRGSGWSTYTMTGDENEVTWIAEDGETKFPAQIVEGNQLEN